MAVIKCKPTSPGRRFVVKVTNPDLHKGRPYAPLLEKKGKTGGRNNAGRITTRHRGVVTSSTIVSSIFVVTKTASRQSLSVWSTIQTVLRTSLC